MKKWWMKGLAVALCAGMLAPAAAVSVPGIGMTVYATNNGAGISGTDGPAAAVGQARTGMDA